MKRSAPFLASLRNKLALLFLAVTALAVAIVFFYVVPQLRSSLEAREQRDLRRVAEASTQLESAVSLELTPPQLDELVRGVADGADARVTLVNLVGPTTGGRTGVIIVSDSRVEPGITRELYSPLAARAIRSNRVETGTTTVEGEQLAQAARPLSDRESIRWVAVYSRSLDDVTSTVSLIRAQVLIAGVIALFVAMIGGYLIARALARRLRRLQEAVEQVAGGSFIGPIRVDSEDELGQLTRSFNAMQERLARLDRARKEFIANASHELRTPIFSLAGFVELLQDEELDPETRDEFLRTMSEQVARLQKLAVDLLDLSRLDAGSLEVATDPVDLAEVARDVVTEFLPASGQHSSDVRLEAPAPGVTAEADRERVAQIVRILVDNALRHTPEGTDITVTARRHNGSAALAVADTGPGIAPASASQVFERFYTADAVRGSGLGLAIAQELAGRMHGSIDLRSRPGRTVFTLELPIADGAGEA